ncbi:MAG: hypothetical protein ACT4OY_07805 [Alphaproteobacteria bacterium]
MAESTTDPFNEQQLSYSLTSHLKLLVQKNDDGACFYILCCGDYEDDLEDVVMELDASDVSFTCLEDDRFGSSPYLDVKLDVEDPGFEITIKNIYSGNGRDAAQYASNVKFYITGKEQTPVAFSESTYRPPGKIGFA